MEAFPQTVIQLFIVIKAGSTVTNFVLFSFLMSLWSIISKTVSEDKLLFKHPYRHIKLKMTKMKHCTQNRCISYKYLSRVIFRIVGILNRTLILFLLWVIVGGFTLFCFLCLELCFLIIASIIAQDSSILAWILKLPLEVPEKLPRLPHYFRIWRWISHVALISIVILMTTMNLNLYCSSKYNLVINLCTEKQERLNLYSNNIFISLSLYCCGVACMLLPFVFSCHIKSCLYDKVVTVDRKLKELLKLEDWRGVSELIEFGFIFDKQEYLEILFHPKYQYFGFDTLWKILWIVETKYGLNLLQLNLNQAQIHSLLMIVSNILQLDEQDSWMLLEGLTNFQKSMLKAMLKDIIKTIDSQEKNININQIPKQNLKYENTQEHEHKHEQKNDDNPLDLGAIAQMAIANYHRNAARTTLQAIKQWDEFADVKHANTGFNHNNSSNLFTST